MNGQRGSDFIVLSMRATRGIGWRFALGVLLTGIGGWLVAGMMAFTVDVRDQFFALDFAALAFFALAAVVSGVVLLCQAVARIRRAH
jgi:hypothetical protein